MNEERRETEYEEERPGEGGLEEGFGEKWRRDPVNAAAWAAILIWAGLVLLAENIGFLVRFEWLETWALIFMGAGGIVLLTVVVRLLYPAYRRPVVGSLVFGVILIAIGLGDLVKWDLIWPLAIIAIGLAILIGGFMYGRKP